MLYLWVKKDDHDCVEQLFMKELNEINNSITPSFYRKGKKKPVSVRLHLVASVCDLPERYNRCGITRGNGNHTSRWGYLCNIDRLVKYLASCPVCMEGLISHVENNPKSVFSSNCNSCTQWNMDNEPLLSSPISPLLNDFNTTNDNLLPARTAEFSTLEKAAFHCYEKVRQGEWSYSQGTRYLSIYGINVKLQSSIMNNSSNEHNITALQSIPEYQNNSIYQNILKQREKDASSFSFPNLPPSWLSPHGILSYIDAPMHLIFLGCVKFLNKRILEWSALFKKESQIIRTFSPSIPSIYDLKLDWCKIYPLSGQGTFSGFVSENWLAVARLMRWMYSRLCPLLKDGSIDTANPHTDVFKWKSADLKKWLALRGLPRKGLVHELKEIVNTYITNPETIPPIKSKYTCPIRLVSDTTIAMVAMIQRLMQPQYSNDLINETENYIKLFLSCVNEWDAKSKDKETKPIWLVSYSLLNLLNFPNMMREFGPVRNLWEGGTMGEGILKLIKHNIPSVNANWHISATSKYYQQKSIARILHQIEQKEDNKDNEKLTPKDQVDNFHLYGSKQNVVNAYNSAQPISIVVDTDNSLYAVVDNMNVCKFEVDNFDEVIFGHNYFEIKPPEYMTFDYTRFQLHTFGLMLPKLNNTIEDNENTDFGIYTIITCDWTEIQLDKTFANYCLSLNKQQINNKINQVNVEQHDGEQRSI